MGLTKIRTVDQAEQARATSIQVMAFSADPIMRWLWPESDAYLRHFPGLVRGFGGGAFKSGTGARGCAVRPDTRPRTGQSPVPPGP